MATSCQHCMIIVQVAKVKYFCSYGSGSYCDKICCCYGNNNPLYPLLTMHVNSYIEFEVNLMYIVHMIVMSCMSSVPMTGASHGEIMGFNGESWLCNWDRGHNSTLIIFEFEMQPTFTCMVTNGYKGFSLLYTTLLNRAWQRFVLLLACSIVVSQKCDTQSAQEALLVITITHFFLVKSKFTGTLPQ